MTGQGKWITFGELHINLKKMNWLQRAELFGLRVVAISLAMFGFGAGFEFSRVGAQFALDIVTGRAAGPGARTMYLALYTTNPNDASTMASIAPGVETTMTGYARQSMAFTAPSAADPPETHNSGVVTFGPVTGSMATVTGFGIVSTSSGASGDFAAWGALTTSRTPTSGDSLQAAIAAFSLTAT